jgi:hypothetical protein
MGTDKIITGNVLGYCGLSIMVRKPPSQDPSLARIARLVQRVQRRADDLVRSMGKLKLTPDAKPTRSKRSSAKRRQQ